MTPNWALAAAHAIVVAASLAAADPMQSCSSLDKSPPCTASDSDTSSLLQLRGHSQGISESAVEGDSQRQAVPGRKDGVIGGEGPGGAPTPHQLQLAMAAALALPRDELRELPVLRGGGEPITMTLQAVRLEVPWIGGHFMTRGYGDVPGPIIRVKPGETLRIKLKNDLGPGPGYESCDMSNAQLGFFMNPDTICALNYTNLHTHGLHVSSKGQGDSIFRVAAPGEEIEYEIPVPANHMPGTHWYHPHHHHATAAQAGGGAHGAIIVDDPPGYLPKYVEDMEEKLLFLSLVNVAKMMRMEAWGHGTMNNHSVWEQRLWRSSAYPDWKWNVVSGLVVEEHGDALMEGLGLTPYVVVNGQFLPKMKVKEGKWYRLRFVLAAIEQRVEVHQTNNEHDQARCELQLLAKDGVYLNEAPRKIDKVFLASGSRADVAVRCSCQPSSRWPWAVKRPCMSHLNFTALWQPMGLPDIAVTMEHTTGRMIHFETEEAQEPAAHDPDLVSFSVRRPCYLADLTWATVSDRNKHTLDLPMLYPMQITVDGKGAVWGHKKPPALANLSLGDIVEFHLTGIRYHPLHVHVNPFQITSIWNDPYYLTGDWQDTFMPTGIGFATVRMNLDRFAGTMIAHCHLLEHEDNGMMGWFNVEGEEGTTSAAAKQLDDGCYEGAFPGPPTPPPQQWSWR